MIAFSIIAKKSRKNPARIRLIIFIYGLNINRNILTIDAIKSGTTINNGTVAENSQLYVDQDKAIVSRHEERSTTSYSFFSLAGFEEASSAPIPFTEMSAAPKFRSQAIFSKFAPSSSAYK